MSNIIITDHGCHDQQQQNEQEQQSDLMMKMIETTVFLYHQHYCEPKVQYPQQQQQQQQQQRRQWCCIQQNQQIQQNRQQQQQQQYHYRHHFIPSIKSISFYSSMISSRIIMLLLLLFLYSKNLKLTITTTTTTAFTSIIIHRVNPISSTGRLHNTMKSNNNKLYQYYCRQQCHRMIHSRTLYMSSSNNNNNNNIDFDTEKYNSNDPYYILNLPKSLLLDSTTTDIIKKKQQIKRAYKKLALQYHPDMVTTKDSSLSDKKRASDRFAKINWAYETVLKNVDNNPVASSSWGSPSTNRGTSSSSSTTTASDGWVPPHRRSGSYRSTATSSDSSSSSSGSTKTSSSPYKDLFSDDYYTSPTSNIYDKEYDTDGDSLGKIFADLVTGSVAAAASSSSSSGAGGIVSDFIEFLERTVDGYSSSSSRNTYDGSNNDDYELQVLLDSNNYNEIVNEMDETELIVQQLQTKLQQINNDIIMVQAELKSSSSTPSSTTKHSNFGERLQYQSQYDELVSQKQIVIKYVTKAQNRLLKLQTKYKQLIVADPSQWTREQQQQQQQQQRSTSSSWDDTNSNNNQGGQRTRNDSTPNNVDDNDKWKQEGFGSFGRGRGSSNRTARRQHQDQQKKETTTTSSSSSSSKNASSNQPSSSSTYGSSTSSTTSRSNTGSSTSSPRSSRPASSSASSYLDTDDGYTIKPPHRRTGGTSSVSSIYDEYQRKEEDQRRLREIKVDEEFDKLKKELGL